MELLKDNHLSVDGSRITQASSFKYKYPKVETPLALLNAYVHRSILTHRLVLLVL